MTWALWAWSALIIAWAVAGAAGNDCAEQKGDGLLTAEDAQTACEAGTGIGVAIILVVGFCGFVVLALIWFMTRPRTQR